MQVDSSCANRGVKSNQVLLQHGLVRPLEYPGHTSLLQHLSHLANKSPINRSTKSLDCGQDPAGFIFFALHVLNCLLCLEMFYRYR